MEKLLEFVSQHMTDDTTRLILDKGKWPDIDMETAVNCIESRRKLKGKVQAWHENPGLIFPLKLSAEQCSSSATGEYKSELAERIAGKASWHIADFTGGLGVDSWFFSQKAEKVLYNEMQTALCEAARHNFKMLEAGNIHISNAKAENGSIERLLDGFSPDIIYMDPARRGEGGKKVFLIEECTPDVLTLKEEIFSICRHILIKLSPMADISMVCDRLGETCREVHVVTSEGECKELLIWMDREWKGGYSITAVELPSGYPSKEASAITFTPEDERTAHAEIADGIGGFLFEPGKSLTKAGAFNMTSVHFQILKLGKSTHYYTTSEEAKADELKEYGKVFKILSCLPLDKRSMKEVGKTYPKADVTARNIPMDTDTLRKKLGVSSGNEIHIFGLKSDTKGNLLLITSRI